MHFLQELVLEALRRIQRFMDDNDALLGSVNQSSARKRLDDIVAQIGTHAVAQVAGRRTAEGETAKQQRLRLALRNDHMRPVAVIAGEKLREQPEFKLLRMPTWNVKGPRLTAAARDMANAAAKYTDLFVQGGLPADFATQLSAAADELDQSIDVRGQSRGVRVGATVGLKTGTKTARGVISVLDSQVRPKLGANEELLRQWLFACHIPRTRTPKTAPAAAGGTSPTAATSPAPSSTPAAAAPSAEEVHTSPTA